MSFFNLFKSKSNWREAAVPVNNDDFDLTPEPFSEEHTAKLQEFGTELLGSLESYMEENPDAFKGLADEAISDKKYESADEMVLRLYPQAVQIVKSHRTCSVSLLQKHLRVGYSIVAKLIEEIERNQVLMKVNA